MRTFLLLLVSVALAVGASAQQRVHNFKMNHEVKQGITLTNLASTPEEIIVDQPEGELKTYNRSGQSMMPLQFMGIVFFYVFPQEGLMDIVFAPDGKTVYMKDPLSTIESNFWVRAELSDDGKYIYMPLDQYIYWDNSANAGIILKWGSTFTNEYEETEFILDDRMSEATFAVDGDWITLLNSEGNAETYEVTGLTGIWTDDQMWCGYIDWDTQLGLIPDAVPAVPADPEVLGWTDEGDESGYNNATFSIPLVDVDGNPLNPANVYYSIFTDQDELFTFEAAEYPGLNENMTLIPYAFSDGIDIAYGGASIYFYRTNAEGFERFFDWRIGMQVYYIVDGVTNASNIVYLEVFPGPTAIDETNVGKTVANVRYFNVAGQEMSEANGLTIVHTTYTDGTTSTAKVVK